MHLLSKTLLMRKYYTYKHFTFSLYENKERYWFWCKLDTQGRLKEFVLEGAWGSGSAQSANFENMDIEMVHSNAIWNAILELQRQVWKQYRACILTLFERFVTS